MGYLEEHEESTPKPKRAIVWQLYGIYLDCRREGKELERIKAKTFYKAAEHLNYETDKAVKVLQSADDHYLKLYADKLKRAHKNGR